MSEELKPCPFCGEGNSRVSLYACDSGYVRVACGACGSHSGTRHERHADAEDRISSLWNTRPIEDALRAELVRWLEEIAGTPPEALWQMQDDRLKYVEIQVAKKDYEAARKRLEELNG